MPHTLFFWRVQRVLSPLNYSWLVMICGSQHFHQPQPLNFPFQFLRNIDADSLWILKFGLFGQLHFFVFGYLVDSLTSSTNIYSTSARPSGQNWNVRHGLCPHGNHILIIWINVTRQGQPIHPIHSLFLIFFYTYFRCQITQLLCKHFCHFFLHVSFLFFFTLIPLVIVYLLITLSTFSLCLHL